MRVPDVVAGQCTERDAETAVSDSARFDAFVRRHRVALVRYAALLAGSRAQGEDIVQDVLVRLYPQWDDLDDPLPYVRRSVTNEFLSWRRRWSTRHIDVATDTELDRAVDIDLDAGPDPELWTQLIALPPQQRAAIVLRFYEALTDDEIAAVLSCRQGTVRAHISRGLATLRRTVTSKETDEHS